MREFVNKHAAAIQKGVLTSSVLLAPVVAMAQTTEPTIDYAAAVAEGRGEILTVLSVLLLPVFGVFAIRRGPEIAMRIFGKAAR